MQEMTLNIGIYIILHPKGKSIIDGTYRISTSEQLIPTLAPTINFGIACSLFNPCSQCQSARLQHICITAAASTVVLTIVQSFYFAAFSHTELVFKLRCILVQHTISYHANSALAAEYVFLGSQRATLS